ncbi:DUF4159 domain-containing protein [Vineibacter terrae]|uniref:DUF4159 domain-containing protein n=1 Tax=Vineibacter terrae TaxID=2586908 RepID=A0A5C8P9S4_9HYPH|nr:DUF4159 domain-containing protein [Vineibacter terrae]TXL69732.1 DUF4159 domain-containing protein [Vineibacter terrae]
MLSLGALAFATPWMLSLLVALPVIYWLLRLLPPAPKLVRFPAIRLLLGLEPPERTPVRIPLWLLLLRLLLVTLLIVALARPLLNPAAELGGQGPLVLLIDDGWASAPNWSVMQRHAERLTERAERANRPVAIQSTAPAALDDVQPKHGLLRPEEARAAIRALKPKPWPTDRAAAVAALQKLNLPTPAHVVWLSDGLDSKDLQAAAERALKLGSLEVIRPESSRIALTLLQPEAGGRELKVKALRAAGDGPRRIAVQGSDDRGAIVARTMLDFAPTATEAAATIDTPTELRNRIARLDIEGQSSAGAAVLLDERFRRRPVGIMGESQTASGQPLLQEVFFLERALEPYAAITIGDRTALLGQRMAIILVPDNASPGSDDRAALNDWIEKGGILVRFAGPRLAASEDELVPVKLRQGDRALGGAMSWGQPAALAEFPATSPFAGLTIPPDVRIQQQVLAEPGPDVGDKTWARLTDGTPLVTGEKRGQGYLVLIHTTANTGWSNLALSGLFVDMLQRLVQLSRGVAGEGTAQQLKPWRALDGFGKLGAPPLGTLPLPPDAMQTFRPRPVTPPGLYGDQSAQVAFNLGGRVDPPAVLGSLPSGVATDRLSEEGETDLSRWFLAAALILLLLDFVIALLLRGLLPLPGRRLGRAAGAIVIAVGLAIAVSPGDVQAQQPQPKAPPTQQRPQQQPPSPPPAATPTQPKPGDDALLRATLETRLAYVITGNREVDEVSRAGLEGLGEILRARTSVEPGDPIGVDLEKDDLRLYPFVYWPITPDQPAPSVAAAANIDRHMKSGGILFLDTRDQHITLGRGGTNADLKRLLRTVDVPPLVAMPQDHVLSKSFYLLSDMPGRWAGGRLWIEAGNGRINDGVAAIIVGANDYAGAWAMESAGRGMFPVAPGGENQREMAFRFGVNLVMYALTGNYKDDAVHLNDIMQRLRR